MFPLWCDSIVMYRGQFGAKAAAPKLDPEALLLRDREAGCHRLLVGAAVGLGPLANISDASSKRLSIQSYIAISVPHKHGWSADHFRKPGNRPYRVLGSDVSLGAR